MAGRNVSLSRPNAATPWGFRLQGGADFRSPLVIQRVTPRSVADNFGLQLGDCIAEINGSPTAPMKHQDAQQAIITSGNRVTLYIARASSPVPTRSAASDVSSITKQTENLNLESTSKPSEAPKPFVSSGTTELPCGDGVATKGKSAMNQQAADSDKIPVCAKCETDIRGPFVLALNKSWCPHHFSCSKCESELVNMGFVELNGKIYCENDYETFFAPKCAKCRSAIVGDTVNALEKTWHPACFVCQECGSPISSGAFHVEDGMPYCMNDWQRLFQTKCTGCSFPVEPGDRWIEALEANWHSECFVCGKCRVKLEGKPFYPRDGKPFCKDHAQG